MKKLLVVVGLVLLASAVTFAQTTDYFQGYKTSYFVDYYSNNSGPVPSAPDQVVRLINVGLGGTPLTSPYGDICANIYVFDNNQELISCCACRLTPNELATASVGTQLTNNPVTSVVPAAGVIKIAVTNAGGKDRDGYSWSNQTCDPTNHLWGADTDYAVAFGTHLQASGGATSVTETNIPSAQLSEDERDFLPTACTFAQYLGSGKGTCSCSVPGL